MAQNLCQHSWYAVLADALHLQILPEDGAGKNQSKFQLSLQLSLPSRSDQSM